MPPKNVFDDADDDISPQTEDFNTFEIDEAYGRRLEHNRKREDLQRLEELKKKGLVDDDDDEDSEEGSDSGEVNVDSKSIVKFFGSLNTIKRKDPSMQDKDFKFYESDESDEDEEDESDKKDEKDQKKKKKMYLKDVQAKQLLEEGPDFVEQDEEKKIKTYVEEQEELKKTVLEAMEGDDDDDDEAFLKVANKEDDLEEEEEDEEVVKTMDEYFGEEAEEDGHQKFLRDFFLKKMWEEKDGKSKIDEEELEEIDVDNDVLARQEDNEDKLVKLSMNRYRHEENAGEIVMGQSRIVEGSVRKKDSSRKAQRKSKEERMKTAEIERQDELKRLKNVKKKDMKEKMKKVLSIAGFKDGEECPLDAKDLDDEFDPEEYDKMMKAAFDDKYYDEEDLELNSEDDDEEEKPDFDKEDELLGLPKDWDVIKGQDGFVAAREKALKLKETDDGNDVEDEEKEREEGEGKRKRKRKTSLVQRAKEALMEEYYKLDYEDTIGDLKTRFRYAKVQPNRYELDTEEILVLDDNELNQYVPLKKMAPYMEKDWEVNRHKVKEQKLKNKTLLEMVDSKKDDEKKSKKKRKKSEETKPVEKAEEEEEGEEAGETSKLSRKAKRRRKQAEKKLPPNRMTAYGKV